MVQGTENEASMFDVPDSVSVIADALIAKFGEGAEEVARRQIEAASPDTVATWLKVLVQISKSAIHP